MSRDQHTTRSLRSRRGAKAPVCPTEPTPAQQAWLDDVRRLLEIAEALEGDGRRLRQARLDAPEAVALRYLVQDMHRALDLVERARAEDRPLELTRIAAPSGSDSLPALRLGKRLGRVLRLDDYRARGPGHA
ncbi:hypothetical protein [Sorangium sp. So ce124]|uniref:hypothetical protein n=1 Tax=Sorangium sp. So ce124 TaxID=3133280 RepID=UPI003F604356